MEPIDVYRAAIQRARHSLTLYDLLHDTRIRAVRSDWALKFNEFMHWPKEELFSRIDGKDQKSILILRNSTGIDRSSFSHTYLTELLRSAIVASVSAMDRYIHDIVVKYCIALLSRAEGKIPNELKKIQIPVLTTKLALEKKSEAENSRPGYLLKLAIQEQLHKEYTFQKPDDVLRATRMLGIEDFWKKVADKMPGRPTAGNVIEKMKKIALRRNQIVHEADVVRKIKAKECTIRDIARKDAEDYVDWIDGFIRATDSVIAECV